MINLLQNIFDKFSLEDIDSLKNVISNQIYQEFIAFFPNLKCFLSTSYENNNLEFIRLLQHIFRSIKVFLLKILKNSNKQDFLVIVLSELE